MSKPDDFTPLADAVGKYLDRTGLTEPLDRARVITDWDELVGPQISQVTKPLGISRDGVLFVEVASSTWMQELQLMSPAILHQLAQRGRRITRIVWRSC